jgi:hypothetical protein
MVPPGMWWNLRGAISSDVKPNALRRLSTCSRVAGAAVQQRG